jgi:hypothetical protein
MDLPLAAREPSPPDRARRGLRLARHHLDARPMDHFLAVPLPGPTTAGLEFAARTHWENSLRFVTESQSQFLDKLRASRCQAEMTILMNFLIELLLWGILVV